MGVATASDFDEYLTCEPRLSTSNSRACMSNDSPGSAPIDSEGYPDACDPKVVHRDFRHTPSEIELDECWMIIKPLTYNNYQTWKKVMLFYCDSHGLAIKPIDATYYNKRCHKRSVEVMELTCSPQMLPYAIHAKSAAEAFKWLEEAANSSEDEREKCDKMIAAAEEARANLDDIPEVDKILTRRNYAKWRAYMKNVFLCKYIWTVVDGTDSRESRDYKVKNHKALMIFRMSCGKEMLQKIYDDDHAYDAWRKLECNLGAASVSIEERGDSVTSTLYEIKIGHELLQFNQRNYRSWEVCMKTHLINQGLWGFLEETEIVDYVNDEKALDEIKLSCHPNARECTLYTACAKDAWKKLEDVSESGQYYYWNTELIPLRVSFPDPEQVLTRFNYKEWKSYIDKVLNSKSLCMYFLSKKLNIQKVDFINACVLRIIKAACGWEMLPYIFGTKNASEAMDILEAAACMDPKDQYMKHSRLLHAVQKNEFREQMVDRNRKHWVGARNYFRELPEALTDEITKDGLPPLQVAVQLGRVDFVRELLEMMNSIEVETMAGDGNNALSIASAGNNIKIVDMLIDKKPDMLISDFPNGDPLTIAAINGNETMLRHLCQKTLLQFKSFSVNYVTYQVYSSPKCLATLLTSAARVNAFDVVFDIFSSRVALHGDDNVVSNCDDNSRVSFYRDDYEMNLLSVLAGMPSAFPSGNQLGVFGGWIYQLVETKPHGKVLKALKAIVPGLNQPIDTKVRHEQALKILHLICSHLPNMMPPELEDSLVYDAVHRSAIHGIIEVFEILIDTNPYLELFKDENERGLFQIAIMYRQENIFQYMSQMGQRNQDIALLDNDGNSALHYAAFWDPSTQKDYGPALQIQRELQWFQEVETVVPPRYKEMKNKDKLTPKALFSLQHKDLAKEAEKWMKEMAQACIIVTALIATVMFAAPFTLPGGTDQNTGVSLILQSRVFKVFTISDVISLFASSISLLMFLSILTARYAECDFLVSLPRRLILGLFTLFVSIATMMATFTYTIVTVLRGEAHSRAYIWVSILASIPVLIFASLQFRLFVNLVSSTYGRGIFRSKIFVPAPLVSIGYG